VIKGGLDANTQQYISIRPNVKVSFEQKYVIRLILAIVSNSWRAFQLLQLDSNIEELQFSQVRKKLQNSKVKLTKFNFDLAMALIRSADDRSASNVLRASEAMEPCVATTIRAVEEPTEFEREPTTLRDRLLAERWPLRYKVKVFNRNETFVELRLTHNNSFQHHCTKIIENHGKNHCALCYHRQTQYGCSLCKVLLCRTPTTKVTQEGVRHRDSCFNKWHSKRDIEAERKKFMKSQKIKGRIRGIPEAQWKKL